MSVEDSDATLLLDAAATHSGIMNAINAFIQNPLVSADDRLVFFFAGHGYTQETIRGNVGYLVPQDGDPADLSTLISWKHISDLFEHSFAKHILFILDACYSGLAIMPRTRTLNQRFIQDLLTRESRQVIASGMKDQVVSDAGGDRPSHSIFTGALLDVLERKVLTENVVTATQMMSHLRNKVGSSPKSQQTPHYGTLYGDGDMLIFAPSVEDISEATIKVTVDYSGSRHEASQDTEALQAKVKSLLDAEGRSIELHDYLIEQVRIYQSEFLELWNKTVQSKHWHEDIPSLIIEFESLAAPLAGIAACIGYWAKPREVSTVSKFFLEVYSPSYIPTGGNTFLIALACYPSVIITHAYAVASTLNGSLENLSNVLKSSVFVGHNKERCSIAKAYAKFRLEMARAEVIKSVPEHARNKFPESERLLLELQPILDASIFPGVAYEPRFQEAEVLLLLASYLDESETSPENWGPGGVFLYKRLNSNFNSSVLIEMEKDFIKQGAGWAPFALGMLGSDLARVQSGFDFAKEWSRSSRW